MRTVTGATDPVVGVGAGHAGVSAALHLLGRGYPGITADYGVDHIRTARRHAARGPREWGVFAPAHVFRQTGPFRRRNLTSRDTDIGLAGSGTTPG
ncbi:hypothetical protein [Rhodococcus sp. SGAir0479]|uniref:hypothetical protein n=1 Tax=Rhodococcus sp. SGAir0479 TaxID=2567884 RepID=UPI0010CD48B6|nr:hypothetical protein [Rhodococcus sp. SGAir0479]QCQ91515.1 hypothetical protein E7742_09875 [Rhodococcus sp. SGAir0479]